MHTIRRENMEHTGYLGNSRVVLNHYDVSTQADIQHMALSYESEDEIMARLQRSRASSNPSSTSTPHYSKQDIREQYCISDRGLGALETTRPHSSLFGCLTSHQNSPCSKQASFLTSCVRQKAPSDENLHELHHKRDYAPYPRRHRYPPWAPIAPDIYRYDEDLKSSYFRRKVTLVADPSRYTWMPSDDESVRMEKPRSILDQGHSPAPKKHVSFARSHTMASFDDVSLASSSTSNLSRMTRSQERLLDVRKPDPGPITRQPEPSDNVILIDKIKRAPMKTQATQTEACLGRKPLPPANINLSPRTIQRVKMVSQGAQTNGFINGRKLMKSYSEVGGQFKPHEEEEMEHEPLQRTQSDEPPRSPFVLISPPPIPEVGASESSSMSHESEDSEARKEIFIDFKPAMSPHQVMMGGKRPLLKTASEGEILVRQQEAVKMEATSVSHEDIGQGGGEEEEEEEVVGGEKTAFRPYFQKVPIRYEGICKPLMERNVYSSISFDDNGGDLMAQDSIEDEFHENLIYNRVLIQEDECVVPSFCFLPDRKLSPFASNDSLSNDLRDHSDGIWNESQATVLQVDSGTDNGTAVSSSELTTSPASAILLTPSSRRKHLLMMQHQQRSSIDTEALDIEEYIEQTELARIVVEKPLKVPMQYLTPVSPSWRRKMEVSESPQAAIVPDLLARTDSGKTNTDVSESTTTDDYITANSGTDSSRKSGSTKSAADYYNLLAEGSSFESAKTISLDDMVVPSSIAEEPSTPVPGRSSPSPSESSSCGSYSLHGSCHDVRAAKVPSKKHPSTPSDKKRPHTLDIKQPPKLVVGDPAKSKRRTRSPMQPSKKHYAASKPKDETDESSADVGQEASPRKSKKGANNARRKSLPRASPTGQRPEKPSSSLPGSLSRRKPAKKAPDEAAAAKVAFRDDGDTTKLKAASAESLRSVSPGSDSVFYSDPSSHAAAGGDHQVHCLHCGKEVDIVTTEDPEKCAASNGGTQDIVQPPAGFEDSPRTKHPRLYKKMDRRFRSEDRCGAGEYRRHRYKPDVRAKSEERGARTVRGKLRPMARSTNNSQEELKCTDSSPSVLQGAPDNEDDLGVYDVPYLEGNWVCIDERDEVQTVNKEGSVSSTESEQEFRKRYQAVTHRMVHRKSCLEMYKRQTSRSFECDKTVVVHRESGEFGFRIHGSKPVVVSAIEPGTPAETSGLEVGDIVLAVNGVSVLDKSHSEVVKIAHAGSDTLSLEVARTCYALNTKSEQDGGTAPLFSGYLWKLSGYASGNLSNKWIRRWFCLKQNNCLYYYKTDAEKQPVGVVMLLEHRIRHQADDENGFTKPHRFIIEKTDSTPLYLAADNIQAEARWLEVIQHAIDESKCVDEFVEETKRNLAAPPSCILSPDCFGYLVKLGTQWKSWSKRYCVLKDACLYFYQEASAKSAFGVAYLQGYRVQQSIAGVKKHAFEIIPPDEDKKHFYFHADSDADRKRWIAALEYSIDRWLKI